MTDEVKIAFNTPEARAIVTHTGDPLDRISVRDYPKEVEIGAFQAERGTMQRINFNVVVEVAESDAAQTDDVDDVLSYDTITEAIEEQLASERINLLETLAERIAERILQHTKAERVFIRIEKLDRIPGTLGVEFVRSKAALNAKAKNLKDDNINTIQTNPMVVFLPNHVLHGSELSTWLDAIERHDNPAIICVEATQETAPKTDIELVDRRIGLLSIEQNGWILASKDKRCFVVGSRTELDWAIKNGQLSVWAPSKIVLDTVNKPEAGPEQPLALAQWFAKEFSADHVSVLKEYDGTENSARVLVVKEPNEL